MMNEQTTNVEKKTLTFSFSKIKPKTNLTIKSTETVKAFEISNTKKTNNDEEEKCELIGSIEGKKVKSLHKSEDDEKKKPLVIPCQKNLLNFNPKIATTTSAEDLEVIKELIKDTLKSKEEQDKDANLTVEMANKQKEAENVEDPNYEQIGIEQFGMAALRGMGWNEKTGIGLNNKRSIVVVEPELRPKGLGLGAGLGKKHKSNSSDSKKEDETSSLRYSKGAYIQVISGKNMDEYGQISGFDDGLNRIIVKLASTDETVSLLQACTRLVSKSDFRRAIEKSKH